MLTWPHFISTLTIQDVRIALRDRKLTWPDFISTLTTQHVMITLRDRKLTWPHSISIFNYNTRCQNNVGETGSWRDHTLTAHLPHKTSG